MTLPSLPHHPKLVVGLTGGIGSGKTAASDWLATQGIVIVDADIIAHEIVAKGSVTLEKIQSAFGDWVLTTSGELDRRALRNHVFGDITALKSLEAITHPAIRERIRELLTQADSPYVILSAPLLLEAGPSGLAQFCQRILVIDVPESLQLSRAAARDGQDAAQIKAIMDKQLSREERLALADDVVNNAGTLEDLYSQLLPLHQQYLSLAATF